MARRYVIVGTGAAGLAAAEAIRGCDPSGDILVLGDDAHGFYSRPGVAYYLAGEIPEKSLSLRQGGDFRRLRALVTEVRPRDHIVVADGREYVYDRLLLATGSVSSRLSVPGSELGGIFSLDNIEDAKGIIEGSRKGRTAVVVGGGFTALELVEGLVSRGMKTHYLLRGDRFWPKVLSKAESGIVENRLRRQGVEIHHNTEVVRVLGEKGRVAEVETSNGRIRCHMVAAGIGVKPRLELARASGLKTDRGIVTDEFLRTSVDDVFAAGDAAQVIDPVHGSLALDVLWGTALEQGRIAGHNMACDKPIPYKKAVSCNVTRMAGVTAAIMGAVGQDDVDDDLLTISRGDSESWRRIPGVMAVQADYEVNHVRLTLGPSTIEGALVIGDQTLTRPLCDLVSNRVDISSIIPELSRPGDSLRDAVIGFWLGWRKHDGEN